MDLPMNKNVSPNELLSGDDDDLPLYVPQKKVYPQRVSGTFRRIKWGLMAFCLGVYYLLPFVRWNRGLAAPDQAVLIDFPNRRFYFFFIELWPQEVYYFTGLLILAAFALFLMNALGGRIWCGYLCPQTVWTDLFYAVERWTEGDRRERIKADAGSMTANRLARRVLKHFIWLMIAWWTGGAWVLYFSDAPTLVKDLATFQAPALAYIWIGILTASTYLLAGSCAGAGLPLHVPLAAHPGGADRRVGAQRHLQIRPRRAALLGQEGDRFACAWRERPAIASTATSASRSARPASTSATARSSDASSAGSASTPAIP